MPVDENMGLHYTDHWLSLGEKLESMEDNSLTIRKPIQIFKKRRQFVSLKYQTTFLGDSWAKSINSHRGYSLVIVRACEVYKDKSTENHHYFGLDAKPSLIFLMCFFSLVMWCVFCIIVLLLKASPWFGLCGHCNLTMRALVFTVSVRDAKGHWHVHETSGHQIHIMTHFFHLSWCEANIMQEARFLKPWLCFCDPDDRSDALLNGKAVKCAPVPQKSLPDLPPPRTVSDDDYQSGLTCEMTWLNMHT